MTDASTAAKAIQDRHELENVGSDSHLCMWCGCADYPCHDRSDAGVVLARLNEAIRLIEAILERHRHWANDLTHGHFCRLCGYGMPCPDYADAVAALALLKGESA